MADFNTTSNIDGSIRAQYKADFIEGAKQIRFYDQLASPVGANMAELSNGSSVTWNYLSGLNPSSQTISETTDIPSVLFTDATGSITKTSRANAVVCSEKLLNNAYTDYGSQWFKRLGENMIESVDALARDAALQGSWYSSSGVARSALDAGTATQRLTKARFGEASVMLSNMKVPQYMSGRGMRWMALFHPYALNDLMQDTVITAVGEYQDKGMILNWELGELNGFSLVVSPWAKIFYGAGADNGTAVGTTLNGAVSRLATTIVVAANTNIAAGQKLAIGTEETGSTTHYADNEEVIVSGISGTTVTIIGSGENGGLRYDHASGVAVRNADHVVPVAFGCPESLVKVYDPEVGEYGELIQPYRDGSVRQFVKAGWKWYGNYGRMAENRILRLETSLSLQA